MKEKELKDFLRGLSKEKLEDIIFKNYQYIVDEYERHKRDVKDFKEENMDDCLKTAIENMNDYELMLQHLDRLIK